MIKPELLAPAGGPKQLKAAVENGADAVYMGGKLFNARQNADNFEDTQLVDAIEYAHVRGVKAYITLNTLITNHEMSKALSYASFVYEAGADAIIVQDLGLAKLLNEMIPDMPLHLSTQGSIYNEEGVNVAANLGFSRVVLARELSKEEIVRIASNAPIQTEVFVHGAMCISYSGQCLMSSMIGGRSGNRGMCAQPCRLTYELFEEDELSGQDKIKRKKSHLLSPKDICLLDSLDELSCSKVAAVKIEGRMKSPEYVAIVTQIYRKYLDGGEGATIATKDGKSEQLVRADKKALMQVFNRGGFTTGYFEGKQGFDMIASERGKHWGTYLGKVKRYERGGRTVDITLEDELSIGDGIEILSDDLAGNLVTSLRCKKDRVQSAKAGKTVTAGYIQGKIKEGQAVYKISDKALNKSARDSFEQGFRKRVPVSIKLSAKIGQPIKICLSDKISARDDNISSKSHSICVESDFIGEKALKAGLSRERAAIQLEKTGGTPFEVVRCEIELEEGLSAPVAAINGLRREAFLQLEAARKKKYPHRKKPSHMPDLKIEAKEGPLGDHTSLYCHRWSGALELPHRNIDRIYLPYDCFFDKDNEAAFKEYRAKGIRLVAAFPVVTRGFHDRQIRERIDELLKNQYVEGFMISNLGHIPFVDKADVPVYADSSLNVFNTFTGDVLEDLGISGATVSLELPSPPPQRAGEGAIAFEAVTEGVVPVMNCEYCPVSCTYATKDQKHFEDKELLQDDKQYYLLDRTGEKLHILRDCKSCTSVIFGSGPISPDKKGACKGKVDSCRINVL